MKTAASRTTSNYPFLFYYRQRNFEEPFLPTCVFSWLRRLPRRAQSEASLAFFINHILLPSSSQNRTCVVKKKERAKWNDVYIDILYYIFPTDYIYPITNPLLAISPAQVTAKAISSPVCSISRDFSNQLYWGNTKEKMKMTDHTHIHARHKGAKSSRLSQSRSTHFGGGSPSASHSMRKGLSFSSGLVATWKRISRVGGCFTIRGGLWTRKNNFHVTFCSK